MSLLPRPPYLVPFRSSVREQLSASAASFAIALSPARLQPKTNLLLSCRSLVPRVDALVPPGRFCFLAESYQLEPDHVASRCFLGKVYSDRVQLDKHPVAA